MNNSDYLGNRRDDRLGVNKIGRNIMKNPPNQPNITNPAQPQIYNINKNDFRSVVQQLTGSPSHHSQQPPPPNPAGNRLQRIRQPKLAPINVSRPQMPPRGAGAGQQPPPMNTAESPISAYMRYLQHSIIDSTQQTHPFPSPRIAGLPPPPPFPSPRMAGVPPPPLFSPSATSQFGLPSPSGYMNLLSPLSPYPLFSPGYQHAMPLNPVFSVSPMARPPPSPGIGFPSPGFFNLSSPIWRN